MRHKGHISRNAYITVLGCGNWGKAHYESADVYLRNGPTIMLYLAKKEVMMLFPQDWIQPLFRKHP